jgi:pimeloyl-ACP methyl ester carboxylesterase
MSSTTTPAGSLRGPHTSIVRTATASGEVDVTVLAYDNTSEGPAKTFLLLHGGGGPGTMAGFAALLAGETRTRVLLPTHPGFTGTPRPTGLASTGDLAGLYVALLDELDATEVTLVGNSFGGWLAAEIALLGSDRVSNAVIVDGVGVRVDGHPPTDVRGLAPQELQKLSWHDPSKAQRPPAGGGSGPSPDLTALFAYTGPDMADPTLGQRLGTLDLEVHVIWGESDGIVDTGFGKAFADAIPQATFTVLPCAGHLPQLETPEALLGTLLGLIERDPSYPPTARAVR